MKMVQLIAHSGVLFGLDADGVVWEYTKIVAIDPRSGVSRVMGSYWVQLPMITKDEYGREAHRRAEEIRDKAQVEEALKNPPPPSGPYR